MTTGTKKAAQTLSDTAKDSTAPVPGGYKVDNVAGDDLSASDLINLVPGATGGSIASVPGTMVVSLPPASSTVLAAVQNFPVAATTALTVRVAPSKVALATAYAYLQDTVTGPVNNGDVPNESGSGFKKSQPPIVVGSNRTPGSVGNFVVGDTFFELSTGLYWRCTTAGAISAARFTASTGTVRESLDDWSADWGPSQEYTFNYTSVKSLSRAASGAWGAAVVYPADLSDYAAEEYTAAVKLAAAKLALPPGTVLVYSGGSILGIANPDSSDGTFKTASENALVAKFEAMYVSGGVVHPSAVGYLKSALNAVSDLRAEDTFDIKPPWYYAGGDGVAGGALGIYPDGLNGTTTGAPKV